MFSSDNHFHTQHNNHSEKKLEQLGWLLIKDFDYLKECIKLADQAGERRTGYYFKSVFVGMIGFLLMLNLKEGFFSNTAIQLLVFISFLFCLLIYGALIFILNIKQNIIVNGYKQELDKIHKQLDNYATDSEEFVQLNSRNIIINNKQGNQVHIIAAFNSIIIALFCCLLLFYVFNFIECNVSRIVCIGFLTFLSSFLFQWSYINIKTKIKKND